MEVKGIEEVIRKYKSGRREDLIPLLQEIQDVYGHLSEEAIIKVGKFVGLSTTKIYGLATFYDQFRFVPSGKIRIRVCNGTTCFLNGSKSIIDKIREETGLVSGQTDRDGNFSYEVVTCMGGCNNGPLISINNDFRTFVRPEQIPDLIKRLRYIIEND
ncbi:MAG: NAD(P)H-dependent oxidoreductase subunit E [Bacteroidales bacterium]|jgi:NADH-quinone oxidoreductase subunit E